MSFTFAPGSVLPAGGRAFVSPDLLAFRHRSESPTAGEGHLVLGPYSCNLAADPCQSLQLLNIGETVIDTWCGDLIGDANGDGFVNTSDILLVISEWGCMGDCQGDVNGDNQVDSMDILLVIEHWS